MALETSVNVAGCCEETEKTDVTCTLKKNTKNREA